MGASSSSTSRPSGVVARSVYTLLAQPPSAEPGGDGFQVVLPRQKAPEARLAAMIGAETPRRAARAWLARSPDLAALRRAVALRGGDPSRLPGDEGRWQPFDPAQRAALRECYADDLFWLAAGADGLARLAEETGPDQAGTHPPSAQTTRGQDHDIEARYLA